jgi:hypothetical protein
MRPYDFFVRLVAFVLGAAVLIGLFFAAKGLYSQIAPTKISGVDIERLKRTEAQLQALQLKYQVEAAPIIKEHDDIVTQYCAQAHLTTGPSGDCQVDIGTGLVTRKVVIPQKGPQGK